ncbi:MAG: hypothetical protein AAB403_04480, partial [Planctomycetota bacterium]
MYPNTVFRAVFRVSALLLTHLNWTANKHRVAEAPHRPLGLSQNPLAKDQGAPPETLAKLGFVQEWVKRRA